MRHRARRKEARQLALTERQDETPRWETLPEGCRREVVALLARLIRNEIDAEEVTDE